MVYIEDDKKEEKDVDNFELGKKIAEEEKEDES